jgi:hypothetical protein
MSSLVYHNPDVTFTYYLIIPHADFSEYRVLLQYNNGSWSLPAYNPQEHHFGVVNHINQFVAEKLGLFSSTLRCLQTRVIAPTDECRFYAMDNLHPEWIPPQKWTWMNETDVKSLTFAHPLQKEVLLQWFDWMHSDSSMRSPWMRHSWFVEASDWMQDLADRMAMDGIQAVEQLRAWSRSCTLRLQTADDLLYFKALPEMFNYEPVITRVLALRFPGNIPDVRAVHVEKGWMLMRDFGGTPLRSFNDIEVWKRVVRRYAEMQVDLIGNTQSMIALGVPDRNVDYLSSQIERLMHDLPVSMSKEEQTELKRLSSSLRSLCFELIEFNIPLSLAHGDFWAENVIIRPNGDPVFFDWSDASISHPFFDIPFFLSEIESDLPHVLDVREQLRDTYLDVWTRYAPMANLRRVYQIAEVLSGLHQALFYYVHVLPGIESNARWEMQNMLPMLLRQVMAAVRYNHG